jgi:hypothetical protein
MQLTIAGFRVHLIMRGAAFEARLRERYAGFIEEPAIDQDGPEAYRLEIEAEVGATPTEFHPTYVSNPEFEARGDLSQASLRGDRFTIEIDWDQRRGAARIPDSLAHLDLAIRITLAGALLRERGTLLHAAAVVRDRFGVVFSGPSGAGKSTIAALCRQGRIPVLADEMVIARRQGAGTRIYGTPFWNGQPGSAPIAAIFILEQAETPAVERLAPPEALPLLMKAGGAPLPLPAIQTAYFDACAELLTRAAAYRLRFPPNLAFWSVIDRLPEFAFFRPRLKQLGAIKRG